MDFTAYTTVKDKFVADPSLCDLFKLLSIETWKRIEFAYLKPKMKVFETTLTQNLVFTINAFNDQFGLNIDIFESLDEITNGNDLELVIRFPSEGVEFYAPIQAKKIYRTGRYSKLDHHGQIESLMHYAMTKKAVPYYLLYNYTPFPIRTGVTLSSPIELTGCTLVGAKFLHDNYYNARRTFRGGVSRLAWKIPDFYNIHPTNALLWHELVCPSTPLDLHSILMRSGLATNVAPSTALARQGQTGSFFPIDTFAVEGNWANIKNLDVFNLEQEKINLRRVYEADVRMSNNEEYFQDSKGTREKAKYVFNPKSKIVITQEKK